MPDQRSTFDQLKDLVDLGNKAGLYDAVDFLKAVMEATWPELYRR